MSVGVCNLTKIIKKQRVLDSVSMTIMPGMIVGLSGENGSGKTMLMRAIAGLIRPTSGTITVDGKQLWKDVSFPEHIGVLIENPAFLDNYTGYSNLQIIASIKNIIGSNDIKKSLQSVGLDPDDRKKYRKYSLGMKQRLGIASALMERPSIVLLDEPMNAIDERGVAMVKSLIMNEKERGASILLSCHDKSILDDLSDEIYYIDEGRIIDHRQAKRAVAANDRQE